MKIIDLSPDYYNLYFVCLEDWSDEIKEAGDHKEKWFNVMKEKGLRIKLALDDNGVVGGMIQYIPIEYSIIEGSDLYFICCIWVHGHKMGRGDFRKKGMGKSLIEAAENDVKSLGGKGLVAWGLSIPVFMRASWFKKQGYTKVDKNGMQVLLWKSFSNDAIPPKWIKQKKTPEKIPGKVNITAFKNGWCPAMNMALERTRRAAREFGDKVVFQEIETINKNVITDWGISDAIFIDGKELRTGPPPKFEKIKKKIYKKVKKL
jgi:hypothetical protein